MSLIGKRRLLLAASVVSVACGAFAGGLSYGTWRARASAEWVEGRLISTAIDSVRANALDSLPSEELIRRAVAGMLRELQDPYAAMLRPDGLERYRGTLQGEGRGLGVHLRRDAEHITISRVDRGSPAWTSGLRTGDRLLFVDGVPATEAWNVRDSVSRAGETLQFVVHRGVSNDTSAVNVVRRSWHMTAVSQAALLTPDIAYVHVGSFSARAADEVEREVERLLRLGASSLVLDLRGNSGGLFEEGVRVASLFLSRGSVVASVMGRANAEPQVHEARGTQWPSLPLTVLVDRNTASAAELVAAALRDHRRALLIGTHTYGKGFVQRVVKLSPDISLRLTTARWLPPSGQRIERRDGQGLDVKGGLAPNILVDDSPRRDVGYLSNAWGADERRRMVSIADSVAAVALNEQWSTNSLHQLLEHTRIRVSLLAPSSARNLTRAAWVSNVARLAALRVLEVRGDAGMLMQLRASEDPVLRTAIELADPENLSVLTTASRAASPAADRDRFASGGQLLETWLVRRFGGAEFVPDSMQRTSASSVRTPMPRVVDIMGARSDTVIALQFVADSAAPALFSGGVAQLVDPVGGNTSVTARVLAWRMYRVPRAISPDGVEGWRYGWAYLAVLPPQSRNAAARISVRGWMLGSNAGMTARHTAPPVAADSITTR